MNHYIGKLFYLDPGAGGTGCHCRKDWPVYYWPATGECFEQESPGPCGQGRYFAYNATLRETECACFKNFAPMPVSAEGGEDEGNTECVELLTRAHCPDGQIIILGQDGKVRRF